MFLLKSFSKFVAVHLKCIVCLSCLELHWSNCNALEQPLVGCGKNSKGQLPLLPVTKINLFTISNQQRKFTHPNANMSNFRAIFTNPKSERTHLWLRLWQGLQAIDHYEKSLSGQYPKRTKVCFRWLFWTRGNGIHPILRVIQNFQLKIAKPVLWWVLFRYIFYPETQSEIFLV